MHKPFYMYCLMLELATVEYTEKSHISREALDYNHCLFHDLIKQTKVMELS